MENFTIEFTCKAINIVVSGLIRREKNDCVSFIILQYIHCIIHIIMLILNYNLMKKWQKKEENYAWIIPIIIN